MQTTHGFYSAAATTGEWYRVVSQVRIWRPTEKSARLAAWRFPTGKRDSCIQEAHYQKARIGYWVVVERRIPMKQGNGASYAY